MIYHTLPQNFKDCLIEKQARMKRVDGKLEYANQAGDIVRYVIVSNLDYDADFVHSAGKVVVKTNEERDLLVNYVVE